jgi:hypothetical protein
MKSSPIRSKQKLSPAAAKRKAVRDTKAAMTKKRKYRKAENQRVDRAEGTVGDGMDRHHTKSGLLKKVTVKNNRGNYGRGTKNE